MFFFNEVGIFTYYQRNSHAKVTFSQAFRELYTRLGMVGNVVPPLSDSKMIKDTILKFETKHDTRIYLQSSSIDRSSPRYR